MYIYIGRAIVEEGGWFREVMKKLKILVEQIPEASILRLKRLQVVVGVAIIVIVGSDGGISVTMMVMVVAFNGGPSNVGNFKHRLGNMYGGVVRWHGSIIRDLIFWKFRANPKSLIGIQFLAGYVPSLFPCCGL